MGYVLVVDDDLAMAELISINLKHAGYEVTIAKDSEHTRIEIDSVLPDLVVLSNHQQSQVGLQLVRRLRRADRTRGLPIILWSEHADESERVRALDTGVDDCLTGRFSANELAARIRAILRRIAPEALDADIQRGNLTLSPSTRSLTVTSGGARSVIKLSATAFRVLHLFMANPGRVYTRNQVLNRVWGDHVYLQERTVDVYVQRLRRALAHVQCAHIIESVRGVGYRLSEDDANSSYVSRSKRDLIVASQSGKAAHDRVTQPVQLDSRTIEVEFKSLAGGMPKTRHIGLADAMGMWASSKNGLFNASDMSI